MSCSGEKPTRGVVIVEFSLLSLCASCLVSVLVWFAEDVDNSIFCC